MHFSDHENADANTAIPFALTRFANWSRNNAGSGSRSSTLAAKTASNCTRFVGNLHKSACMNKQQAAAQYRGHLSHTVSIHLLLGAVTCESAMLCHSCWYLMELDTFNINIIWKLCQTRRCDVSLLYGCESQHALPLQYLTARKAVCLATARVSLQHQLD